MEETKVLTEEERKKRREERRKRKKYRLLILLLLMFGTGVMLATSTYAWFTSNKTVSVNTISAQVEAKGGIQISTDGTKWKSIISTTDITNAYQTYSASANQMPTILEPVSTIGVPDTNGKLPMYYGTVVTSNSPQNNGEYILTAEQVEDKDDSKRKNPDGTLKDGETEGKFIAFDLFFKVEKDTQIYLTPTSGIRFDTTDTGIKNASRVAFVELGNKPDGTALSDIQALNKGTTAPTHIWELNYDAHTSTGLANARDVYGGTSGTAYTKAIAGEIVPYSGIKAAITTTPDILLGKANKTDFADYFENVNIAYKTVEQDDAYDSYLKIFSLTKGISKVRVYVWIEGQDIDCENNASNGKIKFDLQITTEVPEGKTIIDPAA